MTWCKFQSLLKEMFTDANNTCEETKMLDLFLSVPICNQIFSEVL